MKVLSLVNIYFLESVEMLNSVVGSYMVVYNVRVLEVALYEQRYPLRPSEEITSVQKSIKCVSLAQSSPLSGPIQLIVGL